MVDYGYQVTGMLAKGSPVRFTNAGHEIHVVAAGKLKEGKKASDIVAAFSLPDPAASEKAVTDAMDEVDSVSQGIFGPGSVDIPLDLDPANYTLLCFVPTAGEGVPHALKGMVNEVKVVAAEASPAPLNADAAYKVTKGKAIDGPATLTKGRHALQIEGTNGTEQLNPSW